MIDIPRPETALLAAMLDGDRPRMEQLLSTLSRPELLSLHEALGDFRGVLREASKDRKVPSLQP